MNLKYILKRAISRFFSILGLKVYLKALLHFSKQDIKKFVIFAQGRSGSTFLSESIDSHPDIRCDGELLNVKWSGKRLWPSFYVKCAAKTSKVRVYGFHVKVYQLHSEYHEHHRLHQNIDPKKFLLNLHKSGWKIIYMKRNNIFRQTISGIVAKKIGKYHSRNNEKFNLPKLKINVDILLEKMEWIEKFLSYEKEILKTIPHLEINYETDLLKNPEKGMKKVLKYLEVQPCPVMSTLRRTSKDELQDYISNYSEIVECISKTKYSKFLQN